MATYQKSFFSASLNGRPIKIGATNSPGTIIHTTDEYPENIDEIWIYANNTSGSVVTLTIQHGGTTSPDDNIVFSLAANSSMTKIIPGMLIAADDNSTPANIRAFASTTNVVTLTGFVNKIIVNDVSGGNGETED